MKGCQACQPPWLEPMRWIFPSLAALSLLTGCVFEEPFEPNASIPVNRDWLGRWQEVTNDPKREANEMLVLEHSDHEYLVEYPVGEKGMFFRAYAVDLGGSRYIQIQLIGTAEGPVKPQDRKYHLLRVEHRAGRIEMRTINRDVLGKDQVTSEAMRTALLRETNNPKLFDAPTLFTRK
jgi:hypothetical protein